jgi:YgiT-type zinc finger domain-containing protein
MKQNLNETEELNPDQVYIRCGECQTGHMRLKHITYFTWLNNELITVPNFPAWVCDICGRRDYDSDAITLLNTLLNPETGRQSNNKQKSPHFPEADQPQT